ncbi:phage portal protein [Kitasatospora sp. NPDC091335]|uniref:phage portal protein n=1 Tax=Kitasatospora sp. NPDC091335 TaxID=3364085 RepID=UPI0038264383
MSSRMGRFGRALATPFRWIAGATSRAITALPWSAGGPAQSQVSTERALSLIPLWACVRLISEQVASLPLQLYRRDGASREPLSYVPQLLWAPAARDDLFTWLQKCVLSLCLRGNAYGLITQRDDLGFPTMIEWLNPDDVYVDETDPVRPVFYWQGRRVPDADIVHIPWMVLPGHVKGLSPVQIFARTIGVGLETTDYGLSWFRNGGTPPGVLKNGSRTITRDESEEISDRISARIRSRKPLVLGSDWDFTALQVSPEESQFIETMRLNASQVAAIYGVPPTMVGGDSGGSMTYTNVEAAANELVVLTLRPWLVRLENKFSTLMPGHEAVRFNVDAMVRTTIIERYRAHGLALAQGWRNLDEIRALENLGPLPPGAGGDLYGPQRAAANPQPPALEA